MGERVAIITDSTWSLPASVAGEHAVTVVPLTVSAGTASLEDSPENQDIIGALLTKNPTTSQPSRARIRQAYEEAAAVASQIIAIHMSSNLSRTYQGSLAVGSQFATATGIPVRVVDSRHAGGGLGLVVLAAARAARAGATLEEVAAAAKRVQAGVRTHLTVSDLGHLYRGGRLSGTQRLVGAALAMKPLLQVAGGEISLVETVRGSGRLRRRFVERAVRAGLESERINPGADYIDHTVDVIVHHTGDTAAATGLAKQMRAAAAARQLPIKSLEITQISGVLAAHTGPDSLGIVTAPH